MEPMNWNNSRKFEPFLFFWLPLAVCTRRHVTKSSCFEFWGQDDIQTSHPTPWQSQCRLWFHLKSARAVNVAIFCFYLSVTLHAQFFSCIQTTDEEGVPSKRLVNNYNVFAQTWAFLHLSSVWLRSTVFSNFHWINYPCLLFSTGTELKKYPVLTRGWELTRLKFTFEFFELSP